MTTLGATWLGTQLSVASVRSGEELIGAVVAVEPTAVVVHTDVAFDESAFHTGDNLRVGWSDGSRWQHGIAMLVGVEAPTGNYTISLPEPTDSPEVRRSASRVEAFYAIRALIADGSELRTVNGRSLEVSIGGFSARFAEPLAEGVPFAMCLAIGSEVIAAVASIVRYSDRYAHGTFLQIRDRDRERLAAALGMRAITSNPGGG